MPKDACYHKVKLDIDFSISLCGAIANAEGRCNYGKGKKAEKAMWLEMKMGNVSRGS